MGEVYRARDPKLGRTSRSRFCPRSSARIRTGARGSRAKRAVLAALNHPHIAAIYGLEDVTVPRTSGLESVQALVLELVEGPTLAERLARGPVPVREAVTIAAQIADALDAAHEKGIVHRDLKPANVKITTDGGVKVLDFGLAKAILGDGAARISPRHRR